MYSLVNSLNILTAAFENPYAGEEYQLDTKLATQAFTLITNISSVLLGVIVAFLCMLIAITTVTDMLFLTIPAVHEIFTEIIDRRRREGKSASKISLLSKQAIDAYAEATAEGKNIYVLYLKKRLMFYIITATLLFFILVGWSQLIELVAKIIITILSAMNLV